MSGDLWEYLILGTLIWFLAHRIRADGRRQGVREPVDRDLDGNGGGS